MLNFIMLLASLTFAFPLSAKLTAPVSNQTFASGSNTSTVFPGIVLVNT